MRKALFRVFMPALVAAILAVARAQTTAPPANPPANPPVNPPTTPAVNPPVQTSSNPPVVAPPAETPAVVPPTNAPLAPDQVAPPPAAKPKPKKPSVPTYSGELSALDAIQKTITVATKKTTRTFQVTSQTRFLKAGKPAILKDGEVGNKVTVEAKRAKKSKTMEAVLVRYDSKAASGEEPAKPKKARAKAAKAAKTTEPAKPAEPPAPEK